MSVASIEGEVRRICLRITSRSTYPPWAGAGEFLARKVAFFWIGLTLFFGMKSDKKNLGSMEPADELFKDMPEHVQKVYRQAKAHKRKADRKRYMDVMTGKDTSE